MRTVSIIQTKETIHRLETEKDLYRYFFDGWIVWTIFRFPLYFRMIEPFRFNRPAGQVINKWLKRLSFALADLPVFLFPPHKTCIAKTASTMRREKENGLYKDYFLDDYLEQKQKSFFKLEVLNRENFFSHSNDAYIKSHMSTTLIDLLAFFAAKFLTTPGAQQTADALYEEIHEELHEWITPAEIKHLLSVFYWEKRLYARLIKKIAPNYILLTNYFDYALIAAAKETSVPVIEFQHGRTDWYFCQAKTISTEKYHSKLLIPDKIFLFGEFWKKNMADFDCYEERLCVIGSTTMEHYREQKKANKHKKNNGICTLLLTTDFYRQDLISILKQFLQLTKKHIEVRLNVKLHPSYDLDKEKYIAAFNNDNRVIVYPGNELPTTAELITQSDFHLSVNSTCHYEALALQVPTIVMGVENYKIAMHLVNDGHGFFASNAKELLDIIEKNWGTFTVPEEVSEWYYKSGSLENITRELSNYEL